MLKLTLGAAALALIAGMASAGTYTVTVTNNLSEELLAPILIANVSDDGEIFMGSYVTPEAEALVLTGDPAELAARVGPDAMVGKGSDGPPGVLLAPGKSVTFEITTEATAVRVISMVAPTLLPDTYVTNVIDLTGAETVQASLTRFDIGYDEGTKMIFMFGKGMMADEASAGDETMATDETMASDKMMAKAAAATITFVKKM